MTDTVALRAIVLAMTSTPARWHERLAHVGVDTITSSARHEVATSQEKKLSAGTDAPYVSCVDGKLARHTFPDRGSDADDALAIMHIKLCGSLYFLLLKDRKTRYMWVRLVAKKSDVLWEFEYWIMVAERQTKKSMLMLHSDQGGEFLGKDFTDFVDGKGIVHNLIYPYTPQQRDADGGGIRVDDAAAHGRAAPLVAPRPAAGRLGAQLPRRSTLPLGTMLFQLLTSKGHRP
ncbi:unnamed protein product [Closterium sp. NIES-54]